MAARARSGAPGRPLTGSPRRPPGTVSLERALSKLGMASRSEARTLILAGRVSVDGRVARDPATAVVPERVRIAIDGEAREAAGTLTVLLHKPRGVVTTRRDLASSGLLLFTTDTRLAAALLDPANAVSRVYVVTVRGPVDDASLETLSRGLAIDDALVTPRVTLRKRSGRETHLLVELVEGRNREIRRLFAAVGHEVTRLWRVAFGGVELGTLPAGRWRELDAVEIASLVRVAAAGCR